MQALLLRLVNSWRFVLALLLILVIGFWRYVILTKQLIVPQTFPREVVGTIVTDPDVRSDSIFLTVQSADLASKVLVKTARYPEWQYGDEVKVTGQLKLPEAFDTDTGRVFDYPKYLAARGIGLTVSFAQVELVNKSRSWWRFIFLPKKYFTASVNRSINQPESALANGITVGEKQALSKDIQKAFQITSLSHIIVLSGYNVSIVGNSLSHFGSGIGIVGIILFGFMVGGGASVWRAVIMALIAVIGRRLGRTYDALRALIATALVMSAYNPLWLLYDAGFQLSFLATAGILIGTPWWQKKLVRVPERFGLRDTLAVTLGAQMAVLPLLLYLSGILSFTSIPANVLVVPLVPIAMFAVLIVGVVGLVFSPAAVLIGYPVSLLLSYMITVPLWLAKLPGGFITLPAFSGWWALGLYVLWGGWLAYRHHDS